MSSTERLGAKVGIDSMIDALHDWVRTEFIGKGSELQNSLTSVEQAFAAGWMARAYTLSRKREKAPDDVGTIDERVGLPAAMIPPTPMPPTVAWKWTVEADGSRTLNSSFTVVKDDHFDGKKRVNFQMNMAKGRPFSIAAAVGAALAVENSTRAQDISPAL